MCAVTEIIKSLSVPTCCLQVDSINLFIIKILSLKAGIFVL